MYRGARIGRLLLVALGRWHAAEVRSVRGADLHFATHRGVMDRRRGLISTLVVALGVHAILAAAHVVTALITGSIAVTATALDGLTGGAMHLLGLAGIWLGTRPADPKHPYGYARYETLASMFIGVLLFVTGAIVVRDSVARLVDPPQLSAPLLGVGVMLASAVVSLGLHRFLRRRGTQLRSAVLTAEATHAWADAVVDAGVIAGVLLSGFGVHRADPLIGLGVAGLIGWRALSIARGAADVLTDAAIVDPGEIARVACSVRGVTGCHAVRSRGAGGLLQVDLHITVSPGMTVGEGHGIAEEVAHLVRTRLPGVADVLVHVGAGQHGGDSRPTR